MMPFIWNDLTNTLQYQHQGSLKRKSALTEIKKVVLFQDLQSPDVNTNGNVWVSRRDKMKKTEGKDQL